jgi:protein-S-isoprenylcysteine O-methyltransferase Ste14
MEVDDLLLAIFGCLVVGAILVRLLIVHRKTGTLPVFLRTADTAYGFILRINAVIITLEAINIIVYTGFDISYYAYLVPIPYLEFSALQVLGIIIAYLSLALSVVAQAQMGDAWRIGIDREHDAPLVVRGLYSRSRHPIYLGFISITIGLFLAMPNAISLAACLLAVVVLSIEARLEEEFLSSRLGDPYREYLKRTRRWS